MNHHNPLHPYFGFVFLAALLITIPASRAAEGPPREEARVIVDMNDPALMAIQPGVEYGHWHGTGASIAVLRLRRGEQPAVSSQPARFGQELLALVEGEVEVRFAEQTLQMKSGDVGAWGDLEHSLTCRSEECLLFAMLVPIQWRELGLEPKPGETPANPAYFPLQKSAPPLSRESTP